MRDVDTCAYSDLARGECAHCRGEILTGLEPELRVIDGPRGVPVWPVSKDVAAKEAAHIQISQATTDAEADQRTKVARDLTEILSLDAALKGRASDDGGNPIIPGGAAMVALGSVANVEAWENRQQATERYGLAYTSVVDEDPDEAWSAYQLLEFWSEDWRRIHGMDFEPTPHRPRPTVASEANFIRWALDWAWNNEPYWVDFATDINRARVRLENILYAGNRFERSRIECDRCERKPGLLVFRGTADDGSDDRWKCPNPACKARLTSEDVQRAHAKMLRSEGAERWVPQADAISLLKAQGRPERTVRQWLADGEGWGYCDPKTHEVWIWWPDLWRKHLTTPTRKRGTLTSA